MPITHHTMEASAVAECLGVSRSVFLRRRDALEREYGFPPPLPLARPLRWQQAAVEKWLEGYADAGRKRTAATVRETVIENDRARLMAKYARPANENGVAA
ncbi:hypothetical protein [Martelella mangrovi]|uniref:DNA-binding transcriptional regulator AlpA n=1 Tax=Martelella mangrovi TaxID=1397477 RepID=A0ABV2IDL8_9HYPH